MKQSIAALLLLTTLTGSAKQAPSNMSLSSDSSSSEFNSDASSSDSDSDSDSEAEYILQAEISPIYSIQNPNNSLNSSFETLDLSSAEETLTNSEQNSENNIAIEIAEDVASANSNIMQTLHYINNLLIERANQSLQQLQNTTNSAVENIENNHIGTNTPPQQTGLQPRIPNAPRANRRRRRPQFPRRNNPANTAQRQSAHPLRRRRNALTPTNMFLNNSATNNSNNNEYGTLSANEQAIVNLAHQSNNSVIHSRYRLQALQQRQRPSSNNQNNPESQNLDQNTNQ